MNSFNPDLERLAQDGSEWQFGAVAKDLAAVPVAERLKYLPKGVLQFNSVMDTSGCASRGPLNVLETKLDYFYDHGMHDALKEWFNAQGYRKDGKFALNDAFIEILSGTTPTGNSLKAPLDAIRKYGVIPAHLIPLEPTQTWEQYMDKKRITKAHFDLGLEFLKRLTLNYEQVSLGQFHAANEADLMDVALSAWSTPVNGVYPPIEGPFNHCVARVTNDIDIFDNYEPYVKRLSQSYAFFDWGYSLSITAQNPYPAETLALFEVLKKNGTLAAFAEALKRFFALPVEVKPYPNVTPVEEDKDYLTLMCRAIRKHEGWYAGSRSWRNNNPGNCKYSSVGYLPKYGTVGKDKDGFAIFSSYELGWLYLNNLILEKARKHPNWSLVTFFSEYAPASDGNYPASYASIVAQDMGVSPFTWEVKALL